MKAKKWQLQEAKNKFSEVVRKATSEGPQTVTKHGRDSVVIVSVDDYKKIERPAGSLVDFFRTSPLSDIDLDLDRDKSRPRNIQL